MTDFLTVGDLAARWHTTEKAIHAQRHRRQLPPAHRIGRRLLWARADVEAFEAQRREVDRQPSQPAPLRQVARKPKPATQYAWLNASP